MIVSVNFVCDGTANNGKIQLTVDFVDPGQPLTSDVAVFWGITDPNGIAIKPFAGGFPPSFGGVDGYIDASVAPSLEVLVDIPLGSDGNYVLGEYAFRLYMIDSSWDDPGLGGVYYEEEFFYNLDFQTVVENTTVFGDAVLDAEFDCATAEITATDSTSLDGYTLVDRELRLMPPLVPGNPTPTPVETSEAGLVHVFTWNNADYQISLSVIRSYEVEADANWTFTVLEMLTAQTTLHIVCGTEMCDAAACLDAELVTLADLACGQGSWANIPIKSMIPALKKTMYGVLSLLYKECGDLNKAATNAAIAGDCDCGCGDTAASTDITPYTAP